jgi:hypothetical protein
MARQDFLTWTTGGVDYNRTYPLCPTGGVDSNRTYPLCL